MSAFLVGFFVFVFLLVCVSSFLSFRTPFVQIFVGYGMRAGRIRKFKGSREGFERIPLYLSTDDDEDEIVDFTKI